MKGVEFVLWMFELQGSTLEELSSALFGFFCFKDGSDYPYHQSLYGSSKVAC